MKYEYLLFNVLIILGPLLASFDHKVRFVRHWKTALAAVFITMIPFIIWDSLVTGKHWRFNELYTLSLRLAGLPVEEWLFFVTVPFACLFVWEILVFYIPDKTMRIKNLWLAFPIFFILAWLFYASGRFYAFMVFAALIVTFFLDYIFKVSILKQFRTLVFTGILFVLILVFNGYLTSRPVVIYNSNVILNIRIWTIPLEDFGYGFSHIIPCIIVYEKLKKAGSWKKQSLLREQV